MEGVNSIHDLRQSLIRVKPKIYEDERFELVISRRPRLARLFEGLR